MTDKKKKRKYKMLLGMLFCMLLLVPAITGLYLNDLEDVNTDTAISCNLLHYNGTAWTNYDIFNQTITWYKPHTFLDIIHAKSYYGDGGNLTNITASVTLPSYLTSKGHPHNQNLNTTSLPTFTNITLSSLPNWYYLFTHLADWNNITNKPNWITSKGHPHNQNLNTTNNVNFNSISLAKEITTSNTNILYINASNKNISINTNTNQNPEVASPLGVLLGIPEEIYISNDSTISFGNQSSSCAYSSTSQNVNPSTITIVVLAGEKWDNHNEFASNRFTPKVSGTYLITYFVSIQSLDGGHWLEVYPRCRGRFMIGGYTFITNPITNDLCISGSTIYTLGSGDYIELVVRHNSPSAETLISGYCGITIHKIA